MECLSANYNAIDFLSIPENQKYINYSELSKNKNPEAINLIKKRLLEEKNIPYKKLKKEKNRIDWENLSANPKAIELIKQKIIEEGLQTTNKLSLDKMNLSKNPSIFSNK